MQLFSFIITSVSYLLDVDFFSKHISVQNSYVTVHLNKLIAA